MTELFGYASLGVTVGLVLIRPRPRGRELGPAPAIVVGLTLMAAAGLVGVEEIQRTIETAWQPLVTVSSIMVMTSAAGMLGAIRQLSIVTLARAGSSAPRSFAFTFAMSAGVAAVLNNDAAVLLLTPLVLSQVAIVYPNDRHLQVPFAFAVFMAAGVAPLVVSNPMNLIVATYADIGFNEYFLRMAPVGVASDLVALITLLFLFRRPLAAAAPAAPRPGPDPWRPVQIQILALVGAVLVAYPVVSHVGGPIWVVAFVGALGALGLCSHDLQIRPGTLVRRSVPWQILVFLAGMLTIAFGLENAGVVGRLADVYEHAGIALVGVVSSVGSAVMNNHPMAVINLLSLEQGRSADPALLLAALVGGDLGPRLLPIGSLAGLLWLELLRREGIVIPLRQFVAVGATLTVPSLAVSLAVLTLTTT